MRHLILTLILSALAPIAHAADRYMATTGTDSGTCTVGTPCLSLRYAMSQMSGGETLFIADGDYSGTANNINFDHIPPSGTAGSPTIIRAQNIPCQGEAACNQPLKVRFLDAYNFYDASGVGTNSVSYVKFYGIRWNGVVMSPGWSHIYFKQCASMGVLDGNEVAWGNSGQNNLFEDVVGFGKGRYKFLFYDQTASNVDGNNLCRRCIARHDWANRDEAGGNPIAAFNLSYYSDNNALLNSIVIDSDQPEYWQDIASFSEYGGAFYQSTSGAGNQVIGSIAINNAFGFGSFNGSGSGTTIRDSVGINLAGGLNIPQATATVNRLNLYDIGVQNFTYRSTRQSNTNGDGPQIMPNAGIVAANASATVTNSILMGIVAHPDNAWGAVQGYALVQVPNGSNVATNGNTQGSFLSSGAFANSLTGVQSASFQYPVRIESGSTLKTAGTSGGQIGAEIMSKLGIDGTFKGTTDWDTAQGDLWPWPLEDWVKAELASMPATIDGDTMPTAARGFAASGTQLNGTDEITLTSYIWEYLGNEIPADIYGDSDTTAPTITAFTMPSTATSTTVSVSSFTATDDTAVTGYCITTGNSSSGCSWSGSAPSTATGSAGANTFYAWARDAAGNVSNASTANTTITVSVVSGACGTSNNQSLSAAPTTGLCTAGTASSVTGTGPWSWTCAGSGGGTTASCSASYSGGTSTSGTCGFYHGKPVVVPPSTLLCSTGTPTAVTGTGPYTWSCAGSGGGATDACATQAASHRNCSMQ